LSRMTLSFAVALECVRCNPRLGFVERHHDDLDFLQESIQLGE